MLTALVVTQTFGGDEAVTVDARVPGVLAGRSPSGGASPSCLRW